MLTLSRFPLFIGLIFLLQGLGMNTVFAQINNNRMITGVVPPALECSAPIDPSWLDRINRGHINQEAHRISEEPPWASSLPEPTVRVAYLIPSNRTPQPEGVAALQLIIRTARDFFKEHMVYNGLSQKTIRYETEGDGETPRIHVIGIPETDEIIRQDMWNNSINAAMNAFVGVWQRGEVWLLVTETHQQQPDGSIEGWTALGASSGSADDGGVAILGSTLLTPLAQGALTNDLTYSGMIVPTIGPQPLQQNVSFPGFEGSTLSSITSSHMGAFVHELCHALGLGHDFRNDTNFHGNLMGSGLRGIRGHLHPNQYPGDYTRLAFASAQVLNTSHYFNANKQRNQVDQLSVLPNPGPQNGKLIFNVTASDADGLSLLRVIRGEEGVVQEWLLFGGNFVNRQIATPYFEPGINTNYLFSIVRFTGEYGRNEYRGNTKSWEPGPIAIHRYHSADWGSQ